MKRIEKRKIFKLYSLPILKNPFCKIKKINLKRNKREKKKEKNLKIYS
jgi:hypothetical protein